MTTSVRRSADWNIPVAGLARVQCPHPMAIRSLATPATVCIALTFLIGCDDRPSYNAPEYEKANQLEQREWVSSNGRGEYDWTINQQGSFEVARPSPFAFLDELASQKKQTAIWPKAISTDGSTRSESAARWQRPEWMSDVSYSVFRCLTQPASIEIVFKKPADQLAHASAFAIDRDGRYFYCISRGEIQRHLLKAESEIARVHSFDCPVEKPQGLFVGSASESVYVCNSNSIVKVNAIDGTEQARIAIPGTILHWEQARDNDAIVVLTDRNVLGSVDRELKELKMHELDAMGGSIRLNFALQPSGEHAWLFKNNELFRWTRGNGPEPVISWNDKLNWNVVSGRSSECFWNDQRLFFQNAITLVSSNPGLTNALQYRNAYSVNLTDVSVRPLFDLAGEYFLVCGIPIANSETDPEYVVIDIAGPSANGRLSRSVPLPIGKHIKKLLTDATGEHLAVLNNADLLVLRRTPWAGTNCASQISNLAATSLRANEFEQLELCAEELRKLDLPQCGLWGEQLYGQFVEQIGIAWYRGPINVSEREAFNARLEKWLEANGDVASLAYVFSQREVLKSMGQRNNNNFLGFSDTSNVIRNQLAERTTKHIQVSLERLAKTLSGKHPPAIAFELHLALVLSTLTSNLDMEPTIKGCVEMYPSYLSIHKRVVSGMLQNPDHGLLRIRDYATAVSKLYTTELQDEVFALIVGDLLPMPGQSAYSERGSPSLAILDAEQERLKIAIRKWAKRSETNSDVQAIVERFLFESRFAYPERLELADFYMRSFPLSQNEMSEQVLYLNDAKRKALR